MSKMTLKWKSTASKVQQHAAMLPGLAMIIRCSSSNAGTSSDVSKSIISGVWGANTDVGKTLISAGLLLRAATLLGVGGKKSDSSSNRCFYIKPVQTGYPESSDEKMVKMVLKCHGHELESTTLLGYKEAVSPHLAAAHGQPVLAGGFDGRGSDDCDIVDNIRKWIRNELTRTGGTSFGLVETAGGPGSPAPSGALQSDVLRVLRYPAILVGDGKLGGISTTISSYESLKLRGYSVSVIPVIEGTEQNLDNFKIIQQYVDAPVVPLTKCDPPCQSDTSDLLVIDNNLKKWLENNKEQLDLIYEKVLLHDATEKKWLKDARDKAIRTIWWPFTQHRDLSNIEIFDSRYGEYLVMAEQDKSDSSMHSMLYDGCASWWTQGITANHVPGMALSIGNAVGRYGHVIFPKNVHRPALDLAIEMINLVGNGWASRVFFSDNGSTAVEVALKMAFRKYMMSKGILDDEKIKMEVLGLEGAYHGDTLGTMDAVAPSVFNGRLQTPWFEGRGLFLDPPTMHIANKKWKFNSSLSTYGYQGNCDETDSCPPIFATRVSSACIDEYEHEKRESSRERKELMDCYKEYISAAIDNHEGGGAGQTRIGACIIEPVVQGAGGMRLIDPDFQRAMVDICRARGIPVIVDEVFTGLWRLGVPSAAEQLLGIKPDIGCYAKLLTGGMVPMSLTLSNEEIFKAFEGDSKSLALLHGHSYTAHPIGCAAALHALRVFSTSESNPNLESDGSQCLSSLWHKENVRMISSLPGVSGAYALGTVLAVELKASSSGYESNAAAHVAEVLRDSGIYARPLGNVIYLMATPLTLQTTCDCLLSTLKHVLSDI
jgi:dethiobiotin synthetase/adenosylmethionine--8-amino-7-oxononanoate aminotransferase